VLSPLERTDLPLLILQIREWQAHRVATMKSRLRLKNQSRALARRAVGWQINLPEKERARLNRLAEKIVKGIEGGESPQEASPALVAVCLRFQAAREGLDGFQAELEAMMRTAAEKLPAFEWWNGIRGVGPLGLAIIVGEAGDLAQYGTPSKLWKRMGVAPKFCYAMECKDGREAHAIPRRRRSALFTVGDSLLKGNDGEYRQLYDQRKAATVDRGWTKMHAHRDAQRIMEKRLLLKLWKAWNHA
jgi:hypothetical protein